MRGYDHDAIEADAVRGRPNGHDDADRAIAGLSERRLDVMGTGSLLKLQRSAGNEAVTDLVEDGRSPVLDVISSGGSPLESDVRGDMEARLGSDFSDVRVHTGPDAHASAQSVGAHAYTVGTNVVFQRDAYDPGSTAGRTTIAHELTHVVQQRSGPVDGTPNGSGVNVSDPGDSFERAASENAERVMSGPAPDAAVQRESAASAPLPSIQREELPEEDEPEVQGSFVQREEAPEEELA